MAAISNTAATPSRQPRLSTAVGRYRRWHVGTTAVQEDDIWMMTYLDVFTLMLVMMIVMLAFAGPGKGKDGQSRQESPAGQAAASVGPVPGAPPAAAPTGSIVPPPPTPVAAAQPEPSRPTPKTLNGFELDKLGSDIEVLMNDDAVRFRISTELLFESGNANFATAAQPALDKLIPMLNADPNLRLVVEGHTDSMPIQTERFPSNWELSTGRAAAVARYLIERGVAPQRVQASGFADTRPLGSRDNPVDRIHNRRVELSMERSPSTETKPR